MQNILIYLTLFFSISVLRAQTDNSTVDQAGAVPSKYQQGMQKAFQLWGEDKSWEAANLFERIAKAEPDNWLPPYYVAQINVINSFTEKDATKIKAQLDKAQNFINDATFNSKDNPEIMVLQAQWYTAWIVFDGQQYGMTYSAKASELYNKALALAPNNPRIILAKAEWDMGGAKYFGQSVEPYCKDIQRAIDLFATFKPAGEFYPVYGEERAKQIQAKSCK
jgi:tetratricopeptide (TPR) repeat protein